MRKPLWEVKTTFISLKLFNIVAQYFSFHWLYGLQARHCELGTEYLKFQCKSQKMQFASRSREGNLLFLFSTANAIVSDFAEMFGLYFKQRTCPQDLPTVSQQKKWAKFCIPRVQKERPNSLQGLQDFALEVWASFGWTGALRHRNWMPQLPSEIRAWSW